jgi:hypothetical protein
MARRRGSSAGALAQLRATDFGQESYRGYLIRTNAMSGDMWIEKDGQLIARVPASKSWEYARKEIDGLVGPHTNRPRRNPPLVAFGNPRRVVALLSRRVYGVQYKHTDDGKAYQHKFGVGVCMELLSDGSVRLYHKNGKPLFGDF